MRMIDLSTFASRKVWGESGKKHQSATKIIASSRLPTKKKYRAKGTGSNRRVSCEQPRSLGMGVARRYNGRVESPFPLSSRNFSCGGWVFRCAHTLEETMRRFLI